MNKKGFIIVVICLILAIGLVNAAKVENKVEDLLDNSNEIEVIVVLKDASSSKFNIADKVKNLDTKRNKIKQNQDEVLSKLNTAGKGYGILENSEIDLKN